MEDILKIGVDDQIELKQLEISDAQKLFELVDGNRTHLREWLPWVDGTKTVEDSRKFIEGTLEKFKESGTFDLGIYLRGGLVGVVGIHDLSALNASTSIGYWLIKEVQGQGVMTNSVNVLLEYLFDGLNLHRVVIKAAVENNKSQAIPQRLGFKREGIEREAGFLYDHYVDLVVYSLLKSEWKKN